MFSETPSKMTPIMLILFHERIILRGCITCFLLLLFILYGRLSQGIVRLGDPNGDCVVSVPGNNRPVSEFSEHAERGHVTCRNRSLVQ